MELILTPEEVKEKFGPLFCKKFLTIVDEKAKLVEIIEKCSARGPVEWDAVNRTRAGGVVKKSYVSGTELHLFAEIGNRPVNFGPSDEEMGGQALEGVLIKENEVHTKWSGIAGAGLGIVACLAQAPGVLRAIYPTKEDLEKVGGAYTSRVTLVTPKYEKIIVGIDDTDTKEKGATWAIALKIANELQEEGEVELLDHRIIQLNPEVKEKTTNCVSIALVFAAKTEKVEDLISSFVKKLKELAVSEHAHIVIWRGVVIPQEIKEFGKKAKEEILNLDMAKKLVEEIDIEHYKITGERGLIGAIAAIAYADSGIEAAALAKDPALSIIS